MSNCKRFFAFVLAVLISSACVFANGSNYKQPKPAVSTQTTNGNGNKTDIGIWYTPYNGKSEWQSNMGSGFPINHRQLIGYDKNGEHIYGIDESSDPKIIDFQLSEMAKAKIDFILFDLTNGGLSPYVAFGGYSEEPNKFVENTKIICERISIWNDNNDWKIRYAIAVGGYEAIRGVKYENGVQVSGLSIGEATEYQAEGVYNMFYKNAVYGDDHYMLDGKPLLIIHDWGENLLSVPDGWNNYKGTRTYGDKFTVRRGQQGEPGCYGWLMENPPYEHEEVMAVMPGWRSAAGKAGSGHERKSGKLYKTQWEAVLTSTLPRIVMIVAFNDYGEDTAVFTTDTSGCNPAIDEKWIDETGKENPSMYWDMTIDAINRLHSINGDGEYKTVKKNYFGYIFGESEENQNNVKKNNKNENSSSRTLIIIIAVLFILILTIVSILIVKSQKSKTTVSKFDEEYDFDDDDFDDE